MKQTAVEWLLENLINEPYSEGDFKHNEDCWDKAKQMEKEQIINAYEYTAVGTSHYGPQYYKETYESKTNI